MTQPPAAESVIRENLSTYTDPYLGQTLGDAKAVGSVAVRDDLVAIDLVLGFPCADYVPELQAALQSYLGPALGRARFELRLTSQTPPPAVQRPLKPLPNPKHVTPA